MKLYAKVLDEKTKLCSVGEGDNYEYYESLGMTMMEVEQDYHGDWYLEGYAPQETLEHKKEMVRLERVTYRKKSIDDKTLERQRKQANGTWTEEDEQAYLALDAEVTAYIEENLPYPTE